MSECLCLECRLRQVITGSLRDAEIDVNAALLALGPILGELLAHGTTREAKVYVATVLENRKAWLKHPRVLMNYPAGHA